MESLTPEDEDEGSDPDPEPDSDPAKPRPAGPLYVPVRLGSAGHGQLRFARTPLGARTAIGFTSRRRLAAALGDQQQWISLSEPALRALGEPLGAALVTVDPRLATPLAGSRQAPATPCARRAEVLSEEMPV